jgi:hypothetical protein
VKYWQRSRKNQVAAQHINAFLLDTQSGRIFSFTITRAHLGQKVQRQLEIEYAGYIPGFPEHTKDSEAQIVENMVTAAKHTYFLSNNASITSGWKMTLKPTHERKYDFVAQLQTQTLLLSLEANK